MRTERPRRVFGYARVSGAEQGRTGTSLDGQRAEIVRWCTAHAYPDPQIRIEVESGSAEKIERRIELRSLLAELHEGDLVLVCKVDRWSRDIVHGVQSVRALVARGVDWVSIGEGIDASTANGDSMLGIMAWAADNERKRIKERTVGRRRILRDEGRYIEGLVPVGYERGPKNVLRPVEAEAAIVRDMFARCVAGSPVRAIAERLRKLRPDRAWDKKTIATMLHGRVYLGEVRTTAGAWVAAHEPIIDRITWERAQRALESRRLAGPSPTEESRTHHWLLRGLASCAWCGGHMSAAYGPLGRAGDRWGYYMCRAKCGARLAPVEAADAAVEAAMLARLTELCDELGHGPVIEAAEAPDFEERRSRLQRKRAHTIDLATDADVLDRDGLRERLVSIDRALAKIDGEAAALARAARTVLPEVRASILRDVSEIALGWNVLTVPERRRVVEIHASSVAIARDEAPRIEWRSVADLVAD